MTKKDRPICPGCNSQAAIDDTDWDVVMCNCGKWFCRNCGSVPEGICDKCGEADYIRQLKGENKHHVELIVNLIDERDEMIAEISELKTQLKAFKRPLASNCVFCGRYISNVAEGNKPVGNHGKNCELTAPNPKKIRVTIEEVG